MAGGSCETCKYWNTEDSAGLKSYCEYLGEYCVPSEGMNCPHREEKAK